MARQGQGGTAWGSRTVVDRAGVSGAAAYDRVRFGEGGGAYLFALQERAAAGYWRRSMRVGCTRGETVSGYNSCVPLPDGRVLLVPWSATNPLIYDPKRDAITTSAASTPAELQTGSDFAGGVLLGDGRVLLVPYNAPAALVYDPATDTITVTTPPSAAGGFAGGALLADGTVLLLPGTYSDLLECKIWDPATDTYTAAQELADVPAIGLGKYLGGWSLRRGIHGGWWCGSRGWEPVLGGTWRWRGFGIAGREGSGFQEGGLPKIA